MVTTDLRADAHLRPPRWEVSSPFAAFCAVTEWELERLEQAEAWILLQSQETHVERVGDSNGDVWG